MGYNLDRYRLDEKIFEIDNIESDLKYRVATL